MTDALMIILIFGVVFSAVYFFFLDEDLDENTQKRLSELKQGKREERQRQSVDPDDIYEALAKREQAKTSTLKNLLREDSEYRIEALGLLLSRIQMTEKVKGMMKQADVSMPIDVFFGAVLLLALPGPLISIIAGNILFFPMAALGFIPFVILKNKYKKRLKMFSQFFPDSLGIISSSLRAGHSLLSAFQIVAEESSYPINRLFKTVSDEIALGRDVRETMEDMDKHLPGSQDLRFFITAVLIQKEIGGNLAEILDILQSTIRERDKLMGMIKTQTSQAQISGIVLGLAPVFIAGMVSLLNPKYMEPLYKDPMGQGALMLSIGMSALGYFIITKITAIRV
jgi:tight adherence protein B